MLTSSALNVLNHRGGQVFEHHIPYGFFDSSYSNDMCASIQNDELNLRIFIDQIKSEDREEPSFKRFSIIHADQYGEGNYLLETNSWDKVCKFILEQTW